jgi:hypothetical protein
MSYPRRECTVPATSTDASDSASARYRYHCCHPAALHSSAIHYDANFTVPDFHHTEWFCQQNTLTSEALFLQLNASLSAAEVIVVGCLCVGSLNAQRILPNEVSNHLIGSSEDDEGAEVRPSLSQAVLIYFPKQNHQCIFNDILKWILLSTGGPVVARYPRNFVTS